ncbi:MAG TPA: stalk domain-containing protein [Acetivibrio sp.]|nr:stalk domain-containing protein [Acetivibrio sp.]HPT90929.1 stalk domain-containing protein [Acetivibrio sp.]
MKKKSIINIKVLLSFFIILSILCSGVPVWADESEDYTASEYILDAYMAIDEENYDLALDYCNKAISISPKPEYYTLKASIYEYQDKYDEVLNVLDELISISSDYGMAYIEKANIYLKLKKTDEMLKCLDEGIAANPNYITLYLHKAQYFVEIKKNTDAVECYKLGIKNNPNNLHLHVLLSYQLLGLGKDREAFDCLNKIIEINPNTDLAYYNLACLYSKEGNVEKSLQNLKKAVHLSPNIKALALEDPDFDNVRALDGFKALTGVGVYVDGKALEFDVPPTIEEGRVLLPLRVVFETLGASIEWIDSTKTVIAKKDDITLSLQIGSNKATLNGIEVSLDVPAKIVNGRTLVPVRFVSESFKADVKWNPDTKTVYVSSLETNINNTGLSEQAIVEKLDSSVDILSIDGLFPQPYGLGPKDAMILVVAKSEEDLNLFRALSKKQKIEYLNNKVQENYGSVLGCDTIEASFIYDGKMYYSVITAYEVNPEILTLESFKLGLPFNVIVQDERNFTYRYYYEK